MLTFISFRSTFVAAIFAFFIPHLIVPAPAGACLHFDRDYKYKIVEGTKHIFMFHDEKNAHLVVNTDVSVDSTDDHASLPSRLTWVMPFPSMPTKFEEVDSAIFQELGDLLQPDLGTQKGGEGSVGSAKEQGGLRAIRVHPEKIVGRYKIHPIEILSRRDGKEFNEWLMKNRFNPMSKELETPYLKKGAVFLAVEADLKGLKKAELKPLHIVYPAADMEYPLRFTHDTRTFDIDLFVFRPVRLSYAPRVPRPSRIPAHFLKLVSKAHYNRGGRAVGGFSLSGSDRPTLRKLLREEPGDLYRYEGKGINGPGKSLRDLDADPVFAIDK